MSSGQQQDASREAHERWRLIRNSALLVSLVFIWATSWPIIKVAVATIPPIWFGSLRYIIGAACMFGLLLALRQPLTAPRADWPLILNVGGLGLGAYAALTGLALLALPPGRASVLAYSTPLWVVPLAFVWIGERPSLRAVLGMGAGALGILAIAAPSLVVETPGHLAAYAALIAASVAWAISIVFVRRHTFTASSLVLSPWQMLFAAVMLFFFAIGIEGALPPLTWTGLACLAFIGPVSSAFAYWAMLEVGRYFRAATVSMGLLATPSLGILISALTLGETVDGLLILGVALIAFGIVLATRPSAK